MAFMNQDLSEHLFFFLKNWPGVNYSKMQALLVDTTFYALQGSLEARRLLFWSIIPYPVYLYLILNAKSEEILETGPLLVLAQHLAQQQQLKVMAAGGHVGSRWWHRAGSSHFHPSLPAYTPTELITLICLCSLPWDHLRFVRAGIETFCPQTVRQLLKTKQSPAPCVHWDLVKCPQWYKCFPPHFKPSFWPSSPAAIRHLQSLHLHSPTLHLSLGVPMLVASPGPQVPQGGTGWRCHKAVQAARREQGACWLLDVPGSCANMIARWEITQLRNITETGGGSRSVEMVRKAEVASQVPRKATATFQEPFKVRINNNRRS